MNSATPFVRRFQADCDELVAARWWNEAFTHGSILRGILTDENTRRQLLIASGIGAGIWLLVLTARPSSSDVEDVVTMDALQAQRRSGWSVGAAGSRLFYDGLVDGDRAGSTNWRANLPSLVSAISPTQPALLPYFVPTLFQVLDAPDFNQGLEPIRTQWMDEAEAKGRALADVFRGHQDIHDTALLIDAPGPEAVAAAAGVADRFQPVFLFDNWPHPRGVVPSHEVIAATVYDRPAFEAARARRPPDAPPAFVIDSRRLNPYRDASDAFDNRYLARLPGPEGFQRLSVRHLLYVTNAPVDHEADDLNDDFVALRAAGIDVKMVALSDFRRCDAGSAAYSYGGSSAPHVWFWHSYGWYTPARTVQANPPAPSPELGLSRGASYEPVARSTIFSSHAVGGLAGIGKQKPSGFGRVSVRTSRATGAISLERSGSLGRSRSSFFGG
jgi:hypothetical protein